MRLREVTTGIVVSVDDARGAAMVGPRWELADKPAQPDHKGDDAPTKRPARKPRI